MSKQSYLKKSGSVHIEIKLQKLLELDFKIKKYKHIYIILGEQDYNNYATRHIPAPKLLFIEIYKNRGRDVKMI